MFSCVKFLSMFSYLPIFFFKPSELYSSLFCNVLFTVDFLFFPIMLRYNLDALFQQCVCVSSFNPMFSHLPIFFLIFWNYKFASLLPLSMHRKSMQHFSEIDRCSCLLFLLIVLFASGLISACRLSTLAW